MIEKLEELVGVLRVTRDVARVNSLMAGLDADALRAYCEMEKETLADPNLDANVRTVGEHILQFSELILIFHSTLKDAGLLDRTKLDAAQANIPAEVREKAKRAGAAVEIMEAMAGV